MKIRKLQLKNIGVFDDETIDFQEGPEGKAEIHIFTGENGTGKTTLLMALASGFDGRKTEENIYFKLRKRFKKIDEDSFLATKFNDNSYFEQTSTDIISAKSNSRKLNFYQRLGFIMDETAN